jgi:hypothetical protein
VREGVYRGEIDAWERSSGAARGCHCHRHLELDHGGLRRRWIEGSRQQSKVFVVPSSIPHASTCNRSLPDVAAALQRWIDLLPNFSVAQLGSHQCYHAEYPLTIGAKTAVLFDGRGSILASYTDGCAGTRVSGLLFVNCKYPSPVDPLGRTMSDWPRRRFHLQLLGNVKLTVANLVIEGGKDRPGYDGDYAFQHGIRDLWS